LGKREPSQVKKKGGVAEHIGGGCEEVLPSGAVLRIRIHWIHMFLGLQDPDPDPLVRGMDPDPDPSIIMQK
jgi:hypothetical protein